MEKIRERSLKIVSYVDVRSTICRRRSTQIANTNKTAACRNFMAI